MEKIIRNLKEAYNLKILNVEPIEYGLWEENFKIITETDTYFAKRFWKKSRIENRYNEMLNGLELSEDMRENGFPSPMIIKTKENKLLANIEGDVYQINEWIEGKTYHPGELCDEGAYSMGALLGRFHSSFDNELEYEVIDLFNPEELLNKCKNLLCRLDSHNGKFVEVARKTINEKIEILEFINLTEFNSIKIKSRTGGIFSSYWVEQLIFDENNQVLALVDWTDGAGKIGCLLEDIDMGIHLSVLSEKGIIEFCKGYQDNHPMSVEEWESFINLFCYKHLGDTWVYESWVSKHNRRIDHWEEIAIRWITSIPNRYYRKEEIKKGILDALNIEI